MKQHPTQEEWMEFLYDELDAPQKRAIRQHLQSCGECRQRHSEFSSAMNSLDDWRVTVPARHAFARNWMPAVKWAAAAAILATTAFATGRLSKPEVDLAQIQGKIAKPIQENVEREVNARVQNELQALRAETQKTMARAFAANTQQLEQLASTVAALRDEDKLTVYASLKQLEARQISEYQKLQKRLETVAVFADQELKDTQRKLVRLANFSTPTSTTNNH